MNVHQVIFRVLFIAIAIAFSPYAHASSPQLDDDPVGDILKQQIHAQHALESLNTLNPMSAQYGKKAAVVAVTGPYAELHKLLSHPAVQSYLKFFSNPVFMKGVDQVRNHPNRMELLYVELGWVLFMIVLKAWRSSKVSHWIGRVWLKLWTLALFWTGVLLGVPLVVLGSSYYQTFQGFLAVLLKK